MADKEYIERGAALLAITNTGCTAANIEELMKVPVADVVEVRHGEWLSTYQYALKEGLDDDDVLASLKTSKMFQYCPYCDQCVKGYPNYCPNCGAKMDGDAGG